MIPEDNDSHCGKRFATSGPRLSGLAAKWPATTRACLYREKMVISLDSVSIKIISVDFLKVDLLGIISGSKICFHFSILSLNFLKELFSLSQSTTFAR